MNAQQAVARLDWIHNERLRLRALPIVAHEGLGQPGPAVHCGTCVYKHLDAYTAPCAHCARTDQFPSWTPQ
jgi:hypothetical protein